MNLGVDAVFPIHSARDSDFRRGRQLGKKDHLVEWKKPVKPGWMDEETYHSYPATITVREVSVSHQQKGRRSTSRTLVTTFTDASEVSKEEISSLYNCRWFVEINLKAIKETMRMDILRSKTPEMVRKEIWTHLLAYNLIRKIMAQAAILYNRTPSELSFKLAMQMIAAFRQAGILSENNVAVYNELLKAIAYKRVGNRPGRSEPRMVKRRPKPFSRLQKPRAYYHKKKAA
jgi:Transposase DDE domain